MSIASRWLKWSFARSDAARDAGLIAPNDVIRYDALRYGSDSRWQTLDIYRPRCGEGKALPVIIGAHGGGFDIKSSSAQQCNDEECAFFRSFL